MIFDGPLGGHIAPDRYYRRPRGRYRRGRQDGGDESLSTASSAFAGVAVRTLATNPDRRPRPRSRRIIFNKFLKIVSRFVFKLFFMIFDGPLGGHIAPDRHYRRPRGRSRRGREDGGDESLSMASSALAADHCR